MSWFSITATLKARLLAAQSLDRALDAGIPIKRAFRIVSETANSIVIRRSFRGVVAALDRGESIDKALYPQRGALTGYFVEVLVAGQSSGQMHRLLPKLVESLETQVRARRMIVLQLTYPAMILFAFWYAIPFFSGAMLTTDTIENFAIGFFKGVAIQVAYVVALILACRLILKVSPIRLAIGYVFSWIWPIRYVLLRLAAARLLFALAAMLSVGYPNRQAMERAIPLADNLLIAWRLRRALPLLAHGAGIGDVLKRTRIIPADQLLQIQTAEATGLPEKGALQCARQLSTEAMHPVWVLISCLQGIAIVTIGYMIISGSV